MITRNKPRTTSIAGAGPGAAPSLTFLIGTDSVISRVFNTSIFTQVRTITATVETAQKNTKLQQQQIHQTPEFDVNTGRKATNAEIPGGGWRSLSSHKIALPCFLC